MLKLKNGTQIQRTNLRSLKINTFVEEIKIIKKEYYLIIKNNKYKIQMKIINKIIIKQNKTKINIKIKNTVLTVLMIKIIAYGHTQKIL